MVTHYALSHVIDTVTDRNMKGVFIYRDPRDICISRCHYIMREPAHWCHEYFHEVLADDQERIEAVIIGIDEKQLKSIDQHCRTRLDYLDHPRFCTVTFEEPIGPQGGGSAALQSAAIQRIADHLDLRLSGADMKRIARGAFWCQSDTFRKGQIGAWKNQMTTQHRQLFKKVAGQLLVDLAYEADLDW